MDWTERQGVWVSGPYTIELLAPEKWVLSVRLDDAEASSVEVQDWWTGRSLAAMKRLAESIEADSQRVSDRRRYLSILSVAVFVLILAAGLPGPLAAVVTLAAAGTAMYGVIRAIDHSINRRPWDRVSETYQ